MNEWQKLWSAWLPPGMQWPSTPVGEGKEASFNASEAISHISEQILASQRQLFVLFGAFPGSQTASPGAAGDTAFAPFQAMLDAWGQHAGGAPAGNAFTKSVETLREQWTAMFPQAASVWSPWTAAAGQMTSAFPTGLPNFGLADTVSQLIDHPALIGNKATLERLAQRAFQSSFNVQQAVASHQLMIAKGWQLAFARFAAQFQAGGTESTEEVRTLDQLLGLWTRVGEQALQEHARSSDFLDSQSRLLRTAMTYRLDQRRVMEAFARMHDLPTQSDVDEAFKMIHELRREVRRLRKQSKPGLQREPSKTKGH